MKPLKTCPFCGSVAETCGVRLDKVSCSNTKCAVYTAMFTEEEWNLRTEQKDQKEDLCEKSNKEAEHGGS